MPTTITDESTFTSPVVGPADADDQVAASYLPGYQALANRTRWLRDYCTDGGIVLPAPTLHRRYIGAAAASARQLAGGSPDWVPQSLGATPLDAHGVQRSDAAFGELYIDLTGRLVRGGRLSRAMVLVRPGEARTGTDRMKLSLFGVGYGLSLAAPTVTATLVGTEATDDASGDLQWLSIVISGGVDVADHATWYLRLLAGSTADGSGARDHYYAAAVEVTASTIRND